MINTIKVLLKSTPIYDPLRNWLAKNNLQSEYAAWEKAGKPSPPPHLVKQQALTSIAEQYELTTLVETGTFYGDMVAAMQPHFSQIYSIEVSQTLYEKAKKRFKKSVNVTLILGDSGVALAQLVTQLTEPTLFWLDGHYSGGITEKGEKDTPVFEELAHIFDANLKQYVVIIDDARCFGTDPAYPTIEALSSFIKAKLPNATIEVKNDGIRIVPNQ